MSKARKYAVKLTEEERAKVDSILRSKDASRTIKCRAQILKLIDENSGKNLTHKQIAMQLGVAPSTVYLTVKRYAEESSIDTVLTFKHDPTSDDVKRKIDGREEAKLVRLACTKPPESQSRWTIRSLTEASAKILKHPVSRSTVHRVLKNNKIRPHKNEYYCLPPDDEADPDIRRKFTECMENVISVYERTYDPDYPVWCMDEKSLQLLADVRPELPAAPGRLRRLDGEYKRNGTAVLLVYVEPLTGRTYVSTRKRRTTDDWAETVYHLLTVVCPEAKKVTLVLDNLNTHNISSLYKRFSRDTADDLAARLELVKTPVHGSWLNIAEIQISIISRQCLGRRIPELGILRGIMRAWTRKRNRLRQRINWQFTTADARRKLRHLYPENMEGEAA